MIDRIARELIQKRLERFPAVALVGARQIGPRPPWHELLGSKYYDLEQLPERLRLDVEWNSVISGRELVVLDEAQAWPEIFPRLRGAIDGRRGSNGRFLLLGSVSPSLMRSVSESLAGRLALVELPALTLAELPAEYMDGLWRHGGFPDGGVLETGNPRYFRHWVLRFPLRRDSPSR